MQFGVQSRRALPDSGTPETPLGSWRRKRVPPAQLVLEQFKTPNSHYSRGVVPWEAGRGGTWDGTTAPKTAPAQSRSGGPP